MDIGGQDCWGKWVGIVLVFHVHGCSLAFGSYMWFLYIIGFVWQLACGTESNGLWMGAGRFHMLE